MSQTQIVLLVSTAPAVSELVTRALQSDMATTVVFEAHSGAEAVEIARTQPLGLVVVDMDLEMLVSAESLCVKLRALRPTLPILPLSASVDTPALLAELGCAPAVAKAQLVADPTQLRSHVQDALQMEPELRVPEGALSHLLNQADAALQEERRLGQTEVLVLCRNMLLRCGLVHSLASLGIPVQIVESDSDAAPFSADAPVDARLLFGPLSDLVVLQAAAQTFRVPLLLVALHERELLLTPLSELAGANLILFDEAGYILQLLSALQTVAAGSRFLAVPSGPIALWIAPMDSLTAREWQAMVSLLSMSDMEAVAEIHGISATTVETYIKRARHKLGARTLPDALALVQTYLTAQLGVAPTLLRSSAELVQLARQAPS
jgi:DNA-binding NarL/FixJ family response regulator